MPSYYIKNGSFASEISKIWCVCVDFHREEPFIEVEGSLYRLNQVGLEEMDSRAAIHVAGRLLLPGSTDFQHWIPLVNRRSNITVKSRAEPTQRLAGQPRGWADRPAPGPTWLGVLMILTLVNFTLSSLEILQFGT
jgi:hypothetical protein